MPKPEEARLIVGGMPGEVEDDVDEEVAKEEDKPKTEAGSAVAEKVKSEDAAPAKTIDFVVGQYDSCFHFPDFVFLLGWLSSVLIVVVLAFTVGLPAVESIDDFITSTASSNIDISIDVLYIPLYAFGSTAGACIVWTIIMLLCGRCLIHSLCIGMIVLSGFATYYCYENYTHFAIFFLAIFMGITVFYCCSMNAINFATETLYMACKILLQHFFVLVMGMVMLVITFGYLAVWSLGFVGLFLELTYGDDDATGDETDTWWKQVIIYFTYLVFFFWTAEVLKNIVNVTLARISAIWWTTDPAKGGESMCTSLCAFLNACTLNLGCICMGSFIIALFDAIIATCEIAKTQLNKLLGEEESMTKTAVKMAINIVEAIMMCIKSCLEYLTSYVYTFTGIKGYGFCESSMHVFHLLGTNLSTVAANDALVGTLLFIGTILITVGGSTISIWLCDNTDWADGLPDATGYMGSIGGAIGYMVASIIFGLITAANRAVLVLWVGHETQPLLEISSPSDYEELSGIWLKMGNKLEVPDIPGEAPGCSCSKICGACCCCCRGSSSAAEEGEVKGDAES